MNTYITLSTTVLASGYVREGLVVFYEKSLARDAYLSSRLSLEDREGTVGMFYTSEGSVHDELMKHDRGDTGSTRYRVFMI